MHFEKPNPEIIQESTSARQSITPDNAGRNELHALSRSRAVAGSMAEEQVKLATKIHRYL